MAGLAAAEAGWSGGVEGPVNRMLQHPRERFSLMKEGAHHVVRNQTSKQKLQYNMINITIAVVGCH